MSEFLVSAAGYAKVIDAPDHRELMEMISAAPPPQHGGRVTAIRLVNREQREGSQDFKNRWYAFTGPSLIDEFMERAADNATELSVGWTSEQIFHR